MYARLTSINVNAVNEDRADALAERVSAIFEGLPGFKSVTFLMNDERTELGAFSLWETKEQAGATYQEVKNAILSELDGAMTEQPITRIYLAYES